MDAALTQRIRKLHGEGRALEARRLLEQAGWSGDDSAMALLTGVFSLAAATEHMLSRLERSDAHAAEAGGRGRVLKPIIEFSDLSSFRESADVSDPRVFNRVLAVLRSRKDNWNARCDCAFVLCDIKADRAVTELSALTSDADPYVRAAAIRSLADSHFARLKSGPEVLSRLLAMRADQDQRVRRAAQNGICTFHKAEFISTIMSRMEDEDESVRVDTVDSVHGDLVKGLVTQLIARAAGDSSARVRQAIVYLANAIVAPRLLSGLEPLLGDPEEEIRRDVAFLLQRRARGS